MKNSNKENNTVPISTTVYFKGIAIMLIAIHNYLHQQTGFYIENEMFFYKKNVHRFIGHITSGNFQNTVTALFSFLGHYGVQIFIFFSAFGLTIQYNRQREESDFKFVFKRLKKIYFLMFFAIAFAVTTLFLLGSEMSLKQVLTDIVILSTTVGSFFKAFLFKQFSGPYWFFPFIIQVYVLFPFIYKIVNRLKSIHFILPFVVGFLIIYPLFFITYGRGVVLFANVIGHLPEITLGIILGQKQSLKLNPYLVLLSIGVFVGSQFFWWLFPLSFISILIVMIASIQWLMKFTRPLAKDIILYIGKISMIIFIVNGPLRGLSLFSIDDMGLRFERTFLFVIVVLIVSDIMYRIYSAMTRVLKI